MKLATQFKVALVVGLMALVFVGCSSTEGDNTPQRPNEGATPAGTPSMVKVLAPIDHVEVVVAESFPPQYFLHVVSGLPNGCVRFDSYDVSRDGNTIRVTVTNLEPEDRGTICTQVYGTVAHNIPLGADFVSGTSDTVVLNDVTTTFVAQ